VIGCIGRALLIKGKWEVARRGIEQSENKNMGYNLSLNQGYACECFSGIDRNPWHASASPTGGFRNSHDALSAQRQRNPFDRRPKSDGGSKRSK
jgi:hypothetical protein